LTFGERGPDNGSHLPGVGEQGRPGVQRTKRQESLPSGRGDYPAANWPGRDGERRRPVNWEDTVVDAAATDTGMRRSNNQDSLAIVRATTPDAWRNRGHLFMVADGMGAHAVGELASKLACDNIPHNYTKAKNGTPVEAVVKAYKEVGSLIHGKATANRDFEGMGTTCSTLILLPTGAMIAHIGDSRVYRIRGGRIDQLTFDHSLVWELVRHKHLTLEQASRTVPRNVITRSLGPDPTVEVDIEGPLNVEQGDIYLLCSDGLSGPVTDPELGAITANFHPEQAVRYLISLANLRGGLDNITAVIVRMGSWVEPGTGETPVIPEDKTKTEKTRPSRSFSLSGLLSSMKSKPVAPPVEEHIYQTAECPIDDALLSELTDIVRSAQAQAVEHTWSVDWPILANLRREAEDAREAGELRASLRCLGEAIALLGNAGRLHKKEHGSA
jgi:PPM family protein phosphatase